MKLDCHVHSDASLDAYQKFDKILERMEIRKLDGVIVVDHNDMSGADALYAKVLAKYPSPEHRPVVIRGAEYSTEFGHLIVIGLRTPLEKVLNSEARRFKHQEVLDAARIQNAVIIWAHPFRIKHKVPTDLQLSQVDAIEVYNARTAFVRGNYDANQKAIEAAKRLALPIVAGSDGHLPYEIGNAYLEIDCKPRDFNIHNLKTYDTTAIGFATHPMYECISQMYKAVCQKNIGGLLKNCVKLIYSLGQGFDKRARLLNGHVMSYKGKNEKN